MKMGHVGGRVTIAEVAQAAGVSAATVSLVLNGRSSAVRISGATQLAVTETAARLGYTPNHAARMLRRQRSGSVTLLTSPLINPYFTDIAAAVQAVAAARGYSTNIVDTTLPGTKLRALEQLRGGGADGVLIATGHHSTLGADYDALRDLVRHGVPAVMALDRSPSPEIPAIRVDNEGGAHCATTHLIGLGHTRIALLIPTLTGPPDTDPTSRGDRYRGYLRALHEAGIAPDPAGVAMGAEATMAAGWELAHRLLAAPEPHPTAIVAFNDLMALGALRALHEAGRRVPDDVAVIGTGGIEASRYATPALTTVAHPRAQTGREAAELLFALLDGAVPPTAERVLPFELIVRESCGASPGIVREP